MYIIQGRLTKKKFEKKGKKNLEWCAVTDLMQFVI